LPDIFTLEDLCNSDSCSGTFGDDDFAGASGSAPSTAVPLLTLVFFNNFKVIW